MILASFSSITKAYASHSVLSGVSGAIKDGDRIALLGINGSGKTTLLEILARLLEADSGTVEIPRSVTSTYLPQTIEISGDEVLLNYAMRGLQNLLAVGNRLDVIHELLAESPDEPALLRELGELQKIFESQGGYDIESRAADMLRGLGFTNEELQMRVSQLSGGQRNRAALARALVGKAELLFLDEPTNHLDIVGLEYLESFMRSFPGGILFVSHDRTFIQRTATAIWELGAGKISSYIGDYESYLTEREKRLESMTKSFIAQKEFIARTEEFIRRNIAGQKTRQAQSRRRMLAKLERLNRPASLVDTASIQFSGAERSTRIVVKSVAAAFGYTTATIVGDMNFEIERGDRIGLVGPNGSGKTTVLKLITGELRPRAGQIELGRKLSIGYYDQLTENLDPDSTPLSAIWEIKPELNEGQVRAYLARFLFGGEDVYRQIGSFSGGEQSRLALARLIATAPNFLVLDEPTNHLDIPSREALEEALSEFDGTVLCVSHDRYFLDKFAEKIFYVEDGTIRISLGNYSDFHEKIASAAEAPGQRLRKKPGAGKAMKPKIRRVNPIVIQKLESEITSLEGKILQTEELLADEESASDWQKLSGLLNERDHLYEELESLYLQMRNLVK